MTTMTPGHARRQRDPILYPPKHPLPFQRQIDSFLFWCLPALTLFAVVGSYSLSEGGAVVLPAGVGEVLPWLFDTVKGVVVG